MQLDNGVPSVWAHAPSSLSLEPGRIDLWRINLLQPEWVIDRCRRVLCSTELERFARFHFRRHRDRYVVRHGAVRCILAAYLCVPPPEVRFQAGGYGKPEIVDAKNHSKLKFNLSHSGDVALVAVTAGLRIGIDVERVRSDASCVGIAERYFCEGEIAKLKEFPADQQTEAFFDCWTRKEAYVKARGEGLSMPLDSFEVTFGARAPALVTVAAAKPDEIEFWGMYALQGIPGYKAAMVVEGRVHQIKYWDWDL